MAFIETRGIEAALEIMFEHHFTPFKDMRIKLSFSYSAYRKKMEKEGRMMEMNL